MYKEFLIRIKDYIPAGIYLFEVKKRKLEQM